MNDSPLFNLYLTRKNTLNIEYRGVELKGILSEFLVNYSVSKTTNGLIRILKNLFLSIDPSKLSKLIDSEIIFTTHDYRQDHQEFVKLVQKEIKRGAILRKVLEKNNSLFIRPVVLFCSLLQTISYAREVEIYSLFFIISLWSRIVFTKNTLYRLEQVDSTKLKKLVVFNSSRQNDYLLCAAFGKKGVRTYSFQHGYYAKFRGTITEDIINYENIGARYLLCWGGGTINMLRKVGVDPNKLILAGNIKYPNVDVKKFKTIKQPYNCLVLLGRLPIEQGNFKLLEILSEDQFNKYDLRLHPSLETQRYKYYESDNVTICSSKLTLRELLSQDGYDCAIVYNSTSYYESLSCGVPTFRFNFECSEYFEGFDDEFETLEQLHELAVNERLFLADDVKSLLINELGMSVNNYKKILS